MFATVSFGNKSLKESYVLEIKVQQLQKHFSEVPSLRLANKVLA